MLRLRPIDIEQAVRRPLDERAMMGSGKRSTRFLRERKCSPTSMLTRRPKKHTRPTSGHVCHAEDGRDSRLGSELVRFSYSASPLNFLNFFQK